jgi:tetratricopeptide (TPR) repeat protein
MGRHRQPENSPAWHFPRQYGGRFQALRLLKEGLGIATLLGADGHTGQPVVLKVAAAASVGATARLRLEHEAQVLRAARSPFLTPLLAVGQEEGVLFLAMPLVSGVTLRERLAGGPLPVRDALTVGRCLLSALQEAHRHGVLHRDVKPANLLVNEDAPLRQATLIDFGLARSNRLDTSIRDLPAGTAYYMAPEQAGLLHHPVDERSDLYSAGAVLFECLAGRPPFGGDTVGEVLRRHLTEEPPDLRGLGRSVPRALAEVLARLLRKDPAERYHCAEAVRADLEAVADAWDCGNTDPPLVVGVGDRRQHLAEPSFVGRCRELAALDAPLTWARQGPGGLVLLEAESGGGKSRLLNELADRSAQRGAWVLRGQAVDQAARHPFGVLDGVAAELQRAVRAEPAWGAELRSRLAAWNQAICDALPQLAEVLQPGASDGAPEAFGEIRSLRALAALLDALSREGRPALVVLDDCQWADELTLKLLRYWQNRLGEDRPTGLPVRVVAAFRSEEVPARHLLRIMEPLTHLTLSPLQPEDLRGLAESMAGRLPPEALEVVCRLADGSPFMASAVLRGLVETGAIRPGPEGWRVEPRAMADVQSSRQAAALLTRRLRLLPAEATRLLCVGAVLGKEFDVGLAIHLAGQPPQPALEALTEARRRHILWLDHDRGRCTFSHDKLREALLGLLAPEQRRDLHRQAALRLEADASQRIFELAYHFDAAGDWRRALPHALAAAEQARSQHALAIAEEQYLIAERGSREADADTRRCVAEGLGDVLMLRGRYAEAEKRFGSALELAETEVGRARIEGKLGELALKRGDVRGAGEALERGLRLLGRYVPRRQALFVVLLLWEIWVQVLHTFFARAFVGRRRLADAEKELLAIRLYNRMAYAWWFGRSRAAALWTHLRGLNLAERYPATPELAHAYSAHGPAMTIIPLFPRGIAYVEKSLALRRAFSDVWGQGQSLHFHGIVLYATSRFAGCIDKCREAVRILVRMGDQWEINTARWHIGLCLYRLGDLAAAVDEARRLYEAAVCIGDHQAAGISLGIWSKAAGGRVPAQLVQAALGRNVEDVHTAAEVRMAEACRLLREGRPAQAVEHLEDAHRRVRARGLRQEYISPLLPWLATALRHELAATPVWAAQRRRALLRRARRACRQGLRLARSYQNNLPHALRESAFLAATCGRPGRARRMFDESLEVARRQGARAEEAQTLLARGQVGLGLGWAGAAEDVAQAEQTLRALEAELAPVLGEEAAPAARSLSLSQADRFDKVLDAGRRIASALSEGAVFNAVAEAVQTLLRGEYCLVLGVDGEGANRLRPIHGAMPSGFSRSCAERALATGRPVVFEEGLSGEAAESMVLGGIRAALYAPFFVRGRAAGCFCVLHRQAGGLFGADEERLAEFIAAVAGAALENTEGFSQLQRLNETLEARVAERTATAEQRARDLARANEELQVALANVKSLRGLLPICAACKMIRDDRGYWHQVELYVREHSDADFSHCICPGCSRKLYGEYLDLQADPAECPPG